jgi:hypothetical protein
MFSSAAISSSLLVRLSLSSFSLLSTISESGFFLALPLEVLPTFDLTSFSASLIVSSLLSSMLSLVLSALTFSVSSMLLSLSGFFLAFPLAVLPEAFIFLVSSFFSTTSSGSFSSVAALTSSCESIVSEVSLAGFFLPLPLAVLPEINA